MRIHFLGTCAAEGFPGIFCRCEHCMRARSLGGKNIRTRSSVIIDNVLKIDFPPDTYMHVLRDNIDLSQIKDLLITHTHHDHLYPEDLAMRLPVYAHGFDHPLSIYGHDLPLAKCKKIVPPNDLIHYNLIQPYTTIEIETARITPLIADHKVGDETCMIYHIERNGKSYLHGHDSGWFPPATWDWLEGKGIDFVTLECTNGNLPGSQNHLNIEAVKRIQERMVEKQIIKNRENMIVTHFSHNTGLLHDDLVDIFSPLGIDVAYDGKIVEI